MWPNRILELDEAVKESFRNFSNNEISGNLKYCETQATMPKVP